MEENIGQKVKRIFTKTDTYDALVNGPLDAHFGLPQGSAVPKLNVIIDTLAESIKVEFKRFSARGKDINGGFKVFMFHADFLDILLLPESEVNNDGEFLTWLEWLLLRGDEIIISEFGISFDHAKNSRSGKAIMIPRSGKSWRVPTKYSGTIEDNWITRAVEDSMDFLEKLTESVIRHNIEKAL
jgi:hypothetical protein